MPQTVATRCPTSAPTSRSFGLNRWCFPGAALGLTAAGLIALGGCVVPSGARSAQPKASSPPTSVFVLGGIHQTHERARTYTYARLGELVEKLRPDIVCVEVEQRFLDDGTERGMPRDFRKFLVPAARRMGIPIVGIDWEAWQSEKANKWQELQAKAFQDSRLAPEVKVFGGSFELLADYFAERDFEDINSEEVTQLWAARSQLKYAALKRVPDYAYVEEFEADRNAHILANVLGAIERYPGRRILVAIGIDHKYFLERALRVRGVLVLDPKAVSQMWGQRG